MSTSLDGKTALVTGAGRGIGRAVAIGLASPGSKAGLVARTHGELAETARDVPASRGTRVVAPGDLGGPAHSVNPAAELAGAGVTVHAFRPGPVDTAMQAWIRSQDPARIGAALHDRFTRSYESGALITPEHSARSLLAHLNSDATGQIWDVSDPL